MIANFIINLDDYEIEKCISNGAYGNVYIIHQRNNPEKKYAAKISKDEVIMKEDQERFFSDIAPISVIKNPAILTYHGFNLRNFNGESKPTIVMDFMSNGSLRDLLRSKQEFPQSKKYIILLGISIGMNHLHMNGVVHRDLKPENVLIDSNYYPHIADFGESKISDKRLSEVLMSTNRGTCGYMAPEIYAQENGYYTYKVDIFSFAMIAYELITGIEPNSNQKPYKIMSNIEKGIRPDLSPIKSERVKDYLNRCWSANPLERPTFSQIISEISREEYKTEMGADQRDVERYLSLFREAESQINENTLRTEIRADEGDIESMLKIAEIYLLSGEKYPEKRSRAAHYFKTAADSGNADAMYAYGHMLYIGHGIPSSYFKSCSYYREGDNMKDSGAMFRFAHKLYNGIGFPVNKKIALQYYKKAADCGNEDAMYIYGYLKYNGNFKTKKSEAADYFKKCADAGKSGDASESGDASKSGDAMHNYAQMLFNGDGIRKNTKEAIHYFKEAADIGHSDSCNTYATLLYYGTEVEVNKVEAANYFKKAADKGNNDAMFNYATMLYDGDGIPCDKTEAKRYYEMASGKNDPDAIQKVSEMRKISSKTVPSK